MKKIALSIALVLIGQSAPATVFDDCTKAIKADDLDKAKELAATILTFNSISTDNRAAGAACLTYTMGKEYVYSFSLNTFASKDEETARFDASRKASVEKLAADKKRQEQAEEAKRLRRQTELAAKAAKQQQTSDVWRRVYDACTEIYADDPNAAVTNQICLNIFLETGLPK